MHDDENWPHDFGPPASRPNGRTLLVLVIVAMAWAALMVGARTF